MRQLPPIDIEVLQEQAEFLSEDMIAEYLDHPRLPPEAETLLRAELERRDHALATGEETIDELPPVDPRGPLVTVFESSNTNSIQIAKVVLQGEDIPYISRGEGVQDIIGVGRAFGSGNLVTGPMSIQVPQSEFERALAALAEVAR